MIRGSETYRPEVLGRTGVVAAGRHFAAEAGWRMLAAGGNAIDAGVAATFAAAVTEISHFGFGGEAPIVAYLAGRDEVVVISGQGVAPALASAAYFRGSGGIPANGPLAGTVPAIVDGLALALADYGTLPLAEALAPAIALADGFPWYRFLSFYFEPHLDAIRRYPSGARVYLTGPAQTTPPVGSVFRQPELAATLRTIAESDRRHRTKGRNAAIREARDEFYLGHIGQRISRSVTEAGGIMTSDDLAQYRGQVERPARFVFETKNGRYEVCKTSFWSQGPVLLQTLALLREFDLQRMGHNSPDYIHTVVEALKLAFADRDAYYGDPQFSTIPQIGLLNETYASERRKLIDANAASHETRPGHPWQYEKANTPRALAPEAATDAASTPDSAGASDVTGSPDTTCINVVDEQGNLFSAAASSAWCFGGVFIAGETGIPLGNRMQAFVLDESHPNCVEPGKRPRTTLSPTVVLRNSQAYLALSSPGGDSQDQQALQVLLNIAVFGLSPQAAVEAPRFDSRHHHSSFGDHAFQGGALEIEDRIPGEVMGELRRRGHVVRSVGPFMIDSGTTVVGVDPVHGTLFGAADVRRQRFVVGW